MNKIISKIILNITRKTKTEQDLSIKIVFTLIVFSFALFCLYFVSNLYYKKGI